MLWKIIHERMSAFLTKILFIVCSILIDVASLNVETRCEHKDLKVFLIDNLLQGNEISWLNEYVRSQKPWILNQVDDSEDSSLDVKSNTTWISPISKDMLESTRIWNELSMVVKNLTGSKPLLCYAMFTLTYRMDFKPVSRIGKPKCTVGVFPFQISTPGGNDPLKVFYFWVVLICSLEL